MTDSTVQRSTPIDLKTFIMLITVLATAIGGTFMLNDKIEARITPIVSQMQQLQEDRVRPTEMHDLREQVQRIEGRVQSVAEDVRAIRATFDERTKSGR